MLEAQRRTREHDAGLLMLQKWAASVGQDRRYAETARVRCQQVRAGAYWVVMETAPVDDRPAFQERRSLVEQLLATLPSGFEVSSEVHEYIGALQPENGQTPQEFLYFTCFIYQTNQ